jgi:hypothetical protein
MSEIIIPMAEATEYDRSRYGSSRYGITHRSAFVYRTTQSHSPTRIVAWSNVHRLNARDGQTVAWGEYGPIDGGNGRYLDPHRNATDNEVSVLISTESTSIDRYGTGTGTAGSGQVLWGPDVKLAEGDTLILRYAGTGVEEKRTVRFSNNGHGDAV